MVDYYKKGFLDKCAEYHIDGEELLKKAQWNFLGNAMNVGKWFPKYIDLLKGGAKQRKAIAQAFKSKYGVGMGKTLGNMQGSMNEYLSKLQKGLITQDEYAKAVKDLYANYAKHTAPLDQLANNVALARLGTGGALAAGGLYGLNKLTEGSDRPNEMYLG